MTFSETVSIVTGGTTGIGFAIAHALRRTGSRVAICGRSVQRVEKAVTDLGPGVIGSACDLRDNRSVREFADFVRRNLGSPDILINNAGLSHFRPLPELTDDEIEEILDVNVMGQFRMTRAVLDDMLKRGSGQIVNIASLAGRNGFVGGTAYTASKHAVLGFSRSLMLEVRDRGVRVIAVCPGSVNTAFFDRAGIELSNAERVLQPEDVAEAVITCLSLPDRALISELDIRPSNP